MAVPNLYAGTYPSGAEPEDSDRPTPHAVHAEATRGAAAQITLAIKELPGHPKAFGSATHPFADPSASRAPIGDHSSGTLARNPGSAVGDHSPRAPDPDAPDSNGTFRALAPSAGDLIAGGPAAVARTATDAGDLIAGAPAAVARTATDAGGLIAGAMSPYPLRPSVPSPRASRPSPAPADSAVAGHERTPPPPTQADHQSATAPRSGRFRRAITEPAFGLWTRDAWINDALRAAVEHAWRSWPVQFLLSDITEWRPGGVPALLAEGAALRMSATGRGATEFHRSEGTFGAGVGRAGSLTPAQAHRANGAGT